MMSLAVDDLLGLALHCIVGFIFEPPLRDSSSWSQVNTRLICFINSRQCNLQHLILSVWHGNWWCFGAHMLALGINRFVVMIMPTKYRERLFGRWHTYIWIAFCWMFGMKISLSVKKSSHRQDKHRIYYRFHRVHPDWTPNPLDTGCLWTDCQL